MPRCGAPNPDWRMSCGREPHADTTHESNGETWKDGDAPTDRDHDRTRFWMSWTRGILAWMAMLAGVLVILPDVPNGWAHHVVTLAGCVAGAGIIAWVGDAARRVNR